MKNGWTKGYIDRQTNRQMDQGIYRQTDRRTDGWTKGYMDRWIDNE